MPPGRNGKGRFQIGCRPGPGRPARSVEGQYLEATIAGVSVEAWREIVAKARDQAAAGDAKAREWLGRHLLPSPVERLEVGTSGMETRRRIVAQCTDEELELLTRLGERIEQEQQSHRSGGEPAAGATDARGE